MLTKNDIINSANELGINKGDSVIIHSSFKSFGEIENGADTVVGGYKKIENAVVDGYTKIEDKFVDAYLTRDGESVEDAKKRLKNNK